MTDTMSQIESALEKASPEKKKEFAQLLRHYIRTNRDPLGRAARLLKFMEGK